MEIRSSLIGVRTAAAIRPFTQEAEVIASRAPPKPDRKNASAIGFSWKGAVGRFIADRLLEGTVTSELVSGANFPDSWENTGNFVDLGLSWQIDRVKIGAKSGSYGPIPYASLQGTFWGLTGN
jgi:hypothetical protein